MALRNGRTFSDQYHRQVAHDEVDEDTVGAEFAALLDDYCRRVNEEPPPRRHGARPDRTGHA